ncbi:MAG TPA: c-type cytochrome [Labilithrix sp.]|nr:c-type cytochrome [Labilithrix sp.]
MNTKHLAAALALTALTAIACSKSENKGDQPATKTEPGAGTATPSGGGKIDMVKAEAVFNERCAACHGTSGKGDGPASAALNPKPRNYTDKAWQAGVTDEQLRKTITLGGAAVGKSPIMPASPDLDEKPEVVDGLIKIVRRFGS